MCHADEIGYLFKTALTPPTLPEGSMEMTTVKRMIKLWTSFARNGNPNPTTRVPYINAEWHPVKGKDLHFLNIGEDLSVGVNPETERLAFWDTLYNKYSTNFKERTFV